MEKHEIYSKPCPKCPSNRLLSDGTYETDPESQDILNFCASGLISEEDALFVCAWRRKKICKGLWDRYQDVKKMRNLND